MREYLSATNRSLAITGIPSLADIIKNIQTFRNDFTVIPDRPLVLDNLANLVGNIPMGGRQVHDANIVATMQVYGVTHLLTHNVADFARFAHLITLVPLQPGMP